MDRQIGTFEELESFFSTLSSPGIRPGLDRIARLLDDLGHPEQSFPSVHIVGTNGKGSTAAFTESILRASGYRTALYTSPHLVSPAERLLIDGAELPLDSWGRAALRVASVLRDDPALGQDPPSFFETITAAAFHLCAEEKVDIAVVEAGLGGRLDATNLLGDVVLTLITSISMDHMDYLGGTIEAIAREKFAVMRPGVSAYFSGSPSELVPLFRAEAAARGAIAHVSPEECLVSRISVDEAGLSFRYEGHGLSLSVTTPLLGLYQVENGTLAISGAASLMGAFPRITDETIVRGVAEARWPGRFEVLRRDPPLVLDGGHNPDGVRRLVEALTTLYGNRKFDILYAAMKDKDYGQCLSYLRAVGQRLLCTRVPGNDRSESPLLLAERAVASGWPREAIGSFPDPLCAFREVEADGKGVLCSGSLYFIGHMRPRIRSFLGGTP